MLQTEEPIRSGFSKSLIKLSMLFVIYGKIEIVNLRKGHVMIATEFSQCKNSSRNDPTKIDGSDIEIIYTFFEPSDTSSE